MSGERFQRRTRLAALPRESPRGSRFAEPNVVLRGGERHFDYQLIGRRNHVSGYRGIGRSRAYAKSNWKIRFFFHRARRFLFVGTKRNEGAFPGGKVPPISCRDYPAYSPGDYAGSPSLLGLAPFPIVHYNGGTRSRLWKSFLLPVRIGTRPRPAGASADTKGNAMTHILSRLSTTHTHRTHTQDTHTGHARPGCQKQRR